MRVGLVGFAVVGMVGWYGYWAWRENRRTGTTMRQRLAGDEVACVACRTPVAAVKARHGTCGRASCVSAVMNGRNRMAVARLVGQTSIETRPVRWESTPAGWERPLEWEARVVRGARLTAGDREAIDYWTDLD
jgi:hypothetical protein